VTAFTGAGATSCAAFVADSALGTASATDSCPGMVLTRTGVPAGNVFMAGTTTITYTATDAAGQSSAVTQTVTVIDSTPAVVAASLTPAGKVHKKAGTFQVGLSAADNCDGQPSVLAVMAIPVGAEAFAVRFSNVVGEDEDGDASGDERITFDSDRRVITLEGGDEAALRTRLAQILADGGVAVEDGQRLDLRLRETSGHSASNTLGRYQFTFEQGVLTAQRAPSLVLRVTATDDGGNGATATAVPVFAP
jgi:hypothetical protein